MPPYVTGLTSLCLTLFVGCTTTPPSPPPPIIELTCNTPTPCQLRASAPQVNGDMNLALEQVRADWALCAEQVDAIIRCHQKALDTP
ncbi:Rz1-like lysis system protein LysC [Marinimicrobium sp. ARAG 43.8]|uniref:Rz1-like lysis system protein LysC n=1 Tax=Marinimicrobium sp. ARAG 43.8 TaxID=3418719 RepID=UPI003CED8851